MMRFLAHLRPRTLITRGARGPALLFSCLLAVVLSACATTATGGSTPTPTAGSSIIPRCPEARAVATPVPKDRRRAPSRIPTTRPAGRATFS